jgi:exosortase/archaeosortase family protein
MTPALGFAVKFSLMAGLGLAFCYFPYAEPSRVRSALHGYLHLQAVVVGSVIGWSEPHVQVNDLVVAGRNSLEIVKACGAFDVIILLASAILAEPFPLRQRLAAAATGTAVVVLVNFVRILSLYYVGLYAAPAFDFVHLELWPALLILATVLLFFGFVRRAHRSPER